MFFFYSLQIIDSVCKTKLPTTLLQIPQSRSLQIGSAPAFPLTPPSISIINIHKFQNFPIKLLRHPPSFGDDQQPCTRFSLVGDPHFNSRTLHYVSPFCAVESNFRFIR